MASRGTGPVLLLWDSLFFDRRFLSVSLWSWEFGCLEVLHRRCIKSILQNYVVNALHSLSLFSSGISDYSAHDLNRLFLFFDSYLFTLEIVDRAINRKILFHLLSLIDIVKNLEP